MTVTRVTHTVPVVTGERGERVTLFRQKGGICPSLGGGCTLHIKYTWLLELTAVRHEKSFNPLSLLVCV